GSLSAISLGEAVDAALALVQTRLALTGTTVERAGDAGAIMVMGGKVRLQQVIVNILVNALDAMEGVDERRLQIRVEENDEDTVTLHIRDSGLGIDDALLDEIFSPFVTTKNVGEGPGLGLGRRRIQHSSATRKRRSMKPHVLLVDDEADIRKALSQSLDLADIAVDTAASAEEALQFIAPEWSGVMVADVRMPGMDGMELLQRALKVDPDMPVILLTGHGDVAMAVEAMQNGAFNFLLKPCPTLQLVELVRKAFDRRRLVMENRLLRARINRYTAQRVIGNSEA
ncbi:unnamed protein product, partial [Cyprideis torosa]